MLKMASKSQGEKRTKERGGERLVNRTKVQLDRRKAVVCASPDVMQ